MRISATAFTVIVASGLLDPALGEGLRLSQLPLHARYVNVGHSVVTKRRGNTQRNVYFSASGGANSSVVSSGTSKRRAQQRDQEVSTSDIPPLYVVLDWKKIPVVPEKVIIPCGQSATFKASINGNQLPSDGAFDYGWSVYDYDEVNGEPVIKDEVYTSPGIQRVTGSPGSPFTSEFTFKVTCDSACEIAGSKDGAGDTAELLVRVTNPFTTETVDSRIFWAQCVHLYSPRKILRVAQLGDSFSAGNGARAYTSEMEGKCFRSRNNWGSVFTNLLKEKMSNMWSVEYTNFACGGAVMDNVADDRQDLGLLSDCHNYWPTMMEIEEGLLTCTGYAKLQADMINDQFDLILMTISGNDLKFADAIMWCYSPVKKGEKCMANLEASHEFSKSLAFENELKATLYTIHMNAPRAKILLSSYPHLVLDEDTFSIDGYYPSQTLRRYAQELDVIQQKVVNSVNQNEEFVYYFDRTKQVFAGHEPDPRIFELNKNSWFNEWTYSTIDEIYHPTAKGHYEWGKAMFGLFDMGLPVFASLPRELNANVQMLDLAFVIDTTGSMEGTLDRQKVHIADMVNLLSQKVPSYRIAIVSYRDFQQDCEDPDYPEATRVDLGFSSNLDEIRAAINTLTAGGGCDDEEAVLSGINRALNLNWRNGAAKAMIVIGDAPPKLDNNNKEPYTGLTLGDIVARSIALDPVQVNVIDLGALMNDVLEGLVNGTGGQVVAGGDVVESIFMVINATTSQPFAWLGSAYVGMVGEPLLFDASGSYDPNGVGILSFEWDFDGDGNFDYNSTEPFANHTYMKEFNGTAIVRVTSPSGSALGSARVDINAQGYVIDPTLQPCDLDADGNSIFINATAGEYLNCLVTEPIVVNELEKRKRQIVPAPKLTGRALKCKKLCTTRCFRKRVKNPRACVNTFVKRNCKFIPKKTAQRKTKMIQRACYVSGTCSGTVCVDGTCAPPGRCCLENWCPSEAMCVAAGSCCPGETRCMGRCSKGCGA